MSDRSWRVRFGFKFPVPFFPNAGTFVIYMNREDADRMEGFMAGIRNLVAYYRPELTARVFCEAERVG